MQFVGYVFGALIIGHLGDHYGRKRVMLGILFLNIPLGCFISLAPNWKVLAAIRFGNGFLAVGLLVVASTYTIELVKVEQRVLLKTVFNWSNARLLFTLICHVVPKWRTAAIALHLAQLPLLLLLVILPESLNCSNLIVLILLFKN